MGIPEKIKAIEDEMDRTQINKATEHHLGLLRAKIAKLKREQEEITEKKGGAKTDGFDVRRTGDATNTVLSFLIICILDAGIVSKSFDSLIKSGSDISLTLSKSRKKILYVDGSSTNFALLIISSIIPFFTISYKNPSFCYLDV